MRSTTKCFSRETIKLRTAMIFVKDMARMLEFYRDGVGLAFRADESNDEWAELDAGGGLLALHAIPPAIASTFSITTPPTERSSAPIKLVFETDDLEATRARLSAHGAVVKELRSWGAFDAIDPEGNVFQVAKSADSR